jgi:hypothetical protein
MTNHLNIILIYTEILRNLAVVVMVIKRVHLTPQTIEFDQLVHRSNSSVLNEDVNHSV